MTNYKFIYWRYDLPMFTELIEALNHWAKNTKKEKKKSTSYGIHALRNDDSESFPARQFSLHMCSS